MCLEFGLLAVGQHKYHGHCRDVIYSGLMPSALLLHTCHVQWHVGVANTAERTADIGVPHVSTCRSYRCACVRCVCNRNKHAARPEVSTALGTVLEAIALPVWQAGGRARLVHSSCMPTARARAEITRVKASWRKWRRCCVCQHCAGRVNGGARWWLCQVMFAHELEAGAPWRKHQRWC
jgi:hypothetical protein